MTTRDKLAFALELGRRTCATVRQCEALLRLAATYRGLHSLSTSSISPGQDLIARKKLRMANKIMAICCEPEMYVQRKDGLKAQCVPVFDGAVLKIRVPDGGEVVVPA